MSVLQAAMPRLKQSWGHPPVQAFSAVMLGALLIGMATGSMGLGHWVMLTIAGISTGTVIFLMASGMTLIFGLMRVMNMAHGAFIAVGSMVGFMLLVGVSGRGEFYAGSVGEVLLMLAYTLPAAALVGAAVGWVFERVVIRPVYGQPVREILITLGGAVVLMEILAAVNNAMNGGAQLTIMRPESLGGSFILPGDIPVERFRLLIALFGFTVFLGMDWVIRRTRVGLLIRAGVENREMVEVMGFHVRRLFLGVFVVGSALAATGGVLWTLSEGVVNLAQQNSLLVTVVVVVVAGGMGSVTGCLFASILAALVTNYLTFMAPPLAHLSLFLIMAVILSWRPQGLVSK